MAWRPFEQWRSISVFQKCLWASFNAWYIEEKLAESKATENKPAVNSFKGEV